jgi:hypothetical protein
MDCVRMIKRFTYEGRIMTRRRLLCAGIVIALCAAAGAAWADTQPADRSQKLTPLNGPVDAGIIFSTSNILLGLESYEGGLGGKVGFGNLGLRGNFDFQLNGAANAFSVALGVTGEYHLIMQQISPYFGLFTQLGYTSQANVLSAVPFSVGAVAGVEVFIFDFLSVFAEYSFSIDLTLTNNLQTSQTNFDYLIHTSMGNHSKIGVVLYVMRAAAKK